MSSCGLSGCDKPIRSRGRCAVHYNQWLATADRSEVKVIAKRGAAREWLNAHVSYQGDDCLPWPFGKGGAGYGRLHQPGGSSTTASREMCRLAHGDPKDESMHAAHSCGKGHEGCTNPKHLSWKTPGANIADKVVHGTTQHGERNGASKLTAEQVEQIRSSTATGRATAAQFGVSPATVSLIRSGRRWAA